MKGGVCKMMHRFLPLILVVAAAAGATTGHARFEPNDADEIDQEARLNSESYNDGKSYDYPFAWQRDWRRSNLGYRVSAGSLNISKFLYREDFKLVELVPEVGMMSFVHVRNEDFLQQSQHSELRLAGYLTPDHYLGLLAEGGYFKKWGDIGAVVGVGSPAGAYLEAKYFLVDLYYNDKESTSDFYSRQPWAVSLAGRTAPNARGFVEFHYDYDAPIRWVRLSQQYQYTYLRQALTIEGAIPWSETLLLLSKTELERKTESKDWLGFGKSAAFERTVGTEDISLLFAPQDSAIDYNGGATFIYRNSLYHYGNPSSKELPGLSDSEVQPDSERRELMPYLLLSMPLDQGRSHTLRGGPIWSYTSISENNQAAFANEVKLQAAYEFKIGKRVSTLLNTNWDLDNLWVDAPFRERPFRPWDGGNLQIQAVF